MLAREVDAALRTDGVMIVAAKVAGTHETEGAAGPSIRIPGHRGGAVDMGIDLGVEMPDAIDHHRGALVGSEGTEAPRVTTPVVAADQDTRPGGAFGHSGWRFGGICRCQASETLPSSRGRARRPSRRCVIRRVVCRARDLVAHRRTAEDARIRI